MRDVLTARPRLRGTNAILSIISQQCNKSGAAHVSIPAPIKLLVWRSGVRRTTVVGGAGSSRSVRYMTA